jgi:transcriptional regulator with XRE-family HTH domain
MNESEDASLIGRGIRNLRKRKKMTIGELATASGGISPGRLKAIETGAPGLEAELRGVATGLGLDAEHFMPAKNEPEVQSATAPTVAKKSSERTKRSKKTAAAKSPVLYDITVRGDEKFLLDQYAKLNALYKDAAQHVVRGLYLLQVEDESKY